MQLVRPARGMPARRQVLAASSLALAAAIGALQPLPAHAGAELVQVWQAAAAHDRDYALAQATLAAAEPQREQARALWRPTVGLSAGVGVAANATEVRGARFSAPGFGQSSGVGFDTSINHGTSGRWAVSAMQPLYDPQRSAGRRQLELAADAAEFEAESARQTLMLRTAERYYDLALADETLRVARAQLESVQRSATEARDRYRLGSVPVTDTHEAQARLAAIRAQVLADESELEIKRELLADSTGLAPSTLRAALPEGAASAPLPSLEQLQAAALAGNPGLRASAIAVEAARAEATKYSLRASTTVDLVAQAGRDRLAGSGDYGSASNIGSNRMIGIQINVPLYSGGYRSAKGEEALRRVDQAQARSELARQQIAQQLRSAWLGLRNGAARVQALAERLKASRERREATATGLEVGDRTTQQLLDADNDEAAARLALAQARVALVLDRLRLAAIAGTLDETLLRSVDSGNASD